MLRAVRIWDLPVRLFSWLFPVSVLISYFSAGLTGFGMALHILSGYLLLALIVFRTLWGFFGGDGARFSRMLRPPSEIRAQFRDLRNGIIQRYPNHSPLGGLASFLILCLAAATVTAGLTTFARPETAIAHAVLSQILTASVLCYGIVLLLVARKTEQSLWQTYFLGYAWIFSETPVPHRKTQDGLTLLFALMATVIISTAIIGQSPLPADRVQTATATILFQEEETLLAHDFGNDDVTDIAPAAGGE